MSIILRLIGGLLIVAGGALFVAAIVLMIKAPVSAIGGTGGALLLSAIVLLAGLLLYRKGQRLNPGWDGGKPISKLKVAVGTLVIGVAGLALSSNVTSPTISYTLTLNDDIAIETRLEVATGLRQFVMHGMSRELRKNFPQLTLDEIDSFECTVRQVETMRSSSEGSRTTTAVAIESSLAVSQDKVSPQAFGAFMEGRLDAAFRA